MISGFIQRTLIDILMEKLILAVKETGIKEIGLGGGVSANSALRERVMAESEKRGWRCYLPEFRFTTDNAAMIAITGYYKFRQGYTTSLDSVPLSRVLDNF